MNTIKNDSREKLKEAVERHFERLQNLLESYKVEVGELMTRKFEKQQRKVDEVFGSLSKVVGEIEDEQEKLKSFKL